MYLPQLIVYNVAIRIIGNVMQCVPEVYWNVLEGVAMSGSTAMRDWTLLLTASTTSRDLLSAAEARHVSARPHTLGEREHVQATYTL